MPFLCPKMIGFLGETQVCFFNEGIKAKRVIHRNVLRSFLREDSAPLLMPLPSFTAVTPAVAVLCDNVHSGVLSPLSFGLLLFIWSWLAVYLECVVILPGMRESARGLQRSSGEEGLRLGELEGR